MIKSLLIGDNAFIGVSHLSQSRAREKLERLDTQTIVKVVDEAIEAGATGLVFTVHPTNLRILKGLADTGRLVSGFELFPILPYAAGYVRQMNEKGAGGLLRETLSKIPIAEGSMVATRSIFSALRLDPLGLLVSYVDMELSRILKVASTSFQGVLLHEVVTDLCVSFEATHVFDSFIRHLRGKYGTKPGFVTRNLARFVQFAEGSGVSLRDLVVMSPFNSIGFQMNPSREVCESALSKLAECETIAMSVLAGGYLTLDNAVDYLARFRDLSGVVVGVSSKEHARQTFTSLKELVTRPRDPRKI